MLPHLLQQDFAIHFTKKDASQPVPMNVHQGDFTLSDQKACKQCPNKDCENDQPNVVLNIGVQTSRVIEIDYDVFISQLFPQDNKPTNCDYILTSDNAIALCELTCSREKALTPLVKSGGKRVRAHSQLIETKRMLYEVQSIRDYIDSHCARKVLLFGYRLKAKLTQSELAQLTPFLTAPGMSPSWGSEIDDGFLLTQCEFPNEFTI